MINLLFMAQACLVGTSIYYIKIKPAYFLLVYFFFKLIICTEMVQVHV